MIGMVMGAIDQFLPVHFSIITDTLIDIILGFFTVFITVMFINLDSIDNNQEQLEDINDNIVQ